MDVADEGKKGDVRELVLRVLATNFGAIHTSSNVSRAPRALQVLYLTLKSYIRASLMRCSVLLPTPNGLDQCVKKSNV